MPKSSPAPRARRTLTTALFIGAISVTVLAACQGTGGLPPDPQGWGPHTTAAAAPSSTRAASATTTPSLSAAQFAPPRPGHTQATAHSAHPAAVVPIGPVPGEPNAAELLRPWATAIAGHDIATLEGSCWTIAPGSVRAMYADTPGILAALSRPGSRTPGGTNSGGTVWRGPTMTARLSDADIAEGFGCPRVYPNGASTPFDEVDAKYTVRRFLWRLTQTPVSPADREADYPLLCSDHRPNVGTLEPIVAFTDDRATVTPTPQRGMRLRLPVTGQAHTTVPVTFTLELGRDGYCIADVTAPGATLDRSSGR